MKNEKAMLPNDAINKVYDELILCESKILWQEQHGGEIECPCCLDEASGDCCSCHINPPCGYCTREIYCEHSINECIDFIGADEYEKLIGSKQ